MATGSDVRSVKLKYTGERPKTTLAPNAPWYSKETLEQNPVIPKTKKIVENRIRELARLRKKHFSK